ncbi:type IX secretion system outer membrane channel protein PorV [Saprospiraceae bacterium]|jgi:hypothetical protein|nr:type IX secretion system outer membrane channel protein PorV [Bacteroidota bacterium]MDB4727319.1 type IX secretion system outer membrane channel protein PorV [Saprospiraceae bacterium]MDF1863979.1 type IX secretion system outer membrane channel protein PorV [Saprospiraceae bacterium]
MKSLLSKLSLLAAFVLLFSVNTNANCILVCDSNGQNCEWRLADQVTPCPNAIITAVPFLRIVSDARSGAMGDAGIAISGDANAMHFNQSKLAMADEELGVSATYTPWLRALGLTDVYLAYLTGYKKIDDLQAVGVGLRYFSLGDIAFTDINGNAIGNGRPNEFEITAAYSRMLTDKFSAGIGAKFIYSNLASGQEVNGQQIEVGTAGAADISLTYETPVEVNGKESNLTLGLAITNIGSKITYTNAANNEKDFIPTNLGVGVAWEMNFDEYNSMTFTTDINKLLVPTRCLGENEFDCDVDQNGIDDWREESPVGGAFSSFGDAPGGFSEEIRELMYSFGVEYWYDKQFAVRAGYYTEHQTKGNRSFFTVGLGLKYNIFGLNFSYLVPTTNQRNPLDNTLRFSLLFDFGAFSTIDE